MSQVAPADDDPNFIRKVALDIVESMHVENTRKQTGLEDTIGALQAELRRYRSEIAARPAPPEIWWPLPKACVIDGDRTERQRRTDHETMRRLCDNKSIISKKRGKGRGLWSVRMEANPDGRMVPMLRE
jgi:hypothetical protein